MAENLELGTPLYAAHARDRDAGANGLVRYKLAGPGGSNTQGPFAVDGTLGHITLTRYLLKKCFYFLIALQFLI